MIIAIGLPVHSFGSTLSYYLTRMPLGFHHYQQVHEKPYWKYRCPYDKGGLVWEDLGIDETGSLPRLGLADFSGVILILFLSSVIAKMYTSREKAQQAVQNTAANLAVAKGSALGVDGSLHKELLAVLHRAQDLAKHQHHLTTTGSVPAFAASSTAHEVELSISTTNGADRGKGEAAAVLTMDEPQHAVEGMRREMTEIKALLVQQLSDVKLALADSGIQSRGTVVQI